MVNAGLGLFEFLMSWIMRCSAELLCLYAQRRIRAWHGGHGGWDGGGEAGISPSTGTAKPFEAVGGDLGSGAPGISRACPGLCRRRWPLVHLSTKGFRQALTIEYRAGLTPLVGLTNEVVS